MNSRTRKFLSYYRPYLGLLFSVLACNLIATAITLILPLCVRYITKDILANQLPDALGRVFQVGGLMLLLSLIQAGCGYYVDDRGHALGARMESDLRAELFAHLQKLPLRFFDEQRTGQLMSRLTHDLLELAELYHHGPEDYLVYSFKFIGALIILLRINIQLTLAVFIFLPILAIFSLLINRRLQQAFATNQERIGDVNARVEDTLAGIRVMKSFANEAVELEKFARENNRFLESRINTYRMDARFSQGVGLITQFITLAVIVFGGASIVRASLDLADLITYLLYMSSLIEPIQKLAHMTEQLQEGLAGFGRFLEIVAQEPEIQEKANAVVLEHVHGAVEFYKVGFRYRDHHSYVLKGLSLRVSAGEKVALVGSSGVGKTTLCSLIPRFYEASEGEILLDGIPIREIQLQSLRRQIGVVQQDVYLFAGTVWENISYGRPGASPEAIISAAKQAYAHEFIMGLPDGYATDIGQRGVKLSGGQKQRLSIARVFLKDPPVLILDEATSALDNESERVVQESLAALTKNRTTFVIAHRLSTIRNADRILVLTDHGIAEQGTHTELLALNGAYARLYSLDFDPGQPALSRSHRESAALSHTPSCDK